ncbi:MAG: hypothetical protein K8M05_01670, partial [Deltaproteobacteria bacterium]|nr:hypothetical protein [Kofleriaceae bacterium]
LTFRSDVRSASLSPDGETVAFYTDGEIMVVPATGGEPRTIARGIVRDLSAPQLSWRPDGRSLLVTTFDSRATRRDLWSIDLATGERRPLGAARAGEQHTLGDEVIAGHQIKRRLMIGPPGAPSRIECDVEGGYAWLWRVAVLGTVVHVTMETPTGERALLATDAACKPPQLVVPPIAAMDLIPRADGRVFAALRGEPPTAVEVDRRGQPRGVARPLPLGTSQVIGVRRDGGFVVLRNTATWRLVERSASGSRELGRGVGDTVVELAPDRSHLAVIDRRPGEAPALYVTTLDAPEARTRRLVPWARQVAWSPDGALLAATVVDGQRVQLVVVDRESGELRELAAEGISPDADPAWLDDRRIAYNRSDHRAYRWIDRVDGTRGDLIDPAPGWPFELARSPAGDDFALYWNREPEPGVWLFPATGEPRLLHGAAGEQHPVHGWSPDGRTLWVSDGRTVERIDPTTGAPTRFATLELDPTSRVEDIAALADDRVLLHVVTVTSDLVLAGP